MGKIPEHWTTAGVKREYEIQMGKMLQTEAKAFTDMEVPYLKAVNVQWYSVQTEDVQKMWASKGEIEQLAVLPGDLLVCEGGEGGRAGIVTTIPRGFIIQNALHRVRSKKDAKNEFLQHLMRVISDSGWFEAINSKATIAHFTKEKFEALPIPVPSSEEQAAIVRFLDHADEQIQRYIAGKERLIALLEEQRQTLVHQAVTRGLDLNVRLKPSGVEWLGDVPEHWEMRRLGQCTSVSGGATPSMEVNRFWGGSVPWVTPKDMKKDVISDSSMKVTNAAIQETSLQLVEPPVVLMVVRGMILARRVPIAYTTTPVTINQDMKALRTLRGTDAIFLAYSLNSVQEAFKPLIDEAGHGTRRLPVERWRELPITMPPTSEQRAIIEYLDNTTAEINAAIDCSRRQIKFMNEYRTRLIADVVTGQLDVRKAAAQLPAAP